jgi:cell division protein ZapA
MAKNVTEVVIAGKIISISGEEDAAYMTEVASFINDKLSELQKTDNYHKLSADQQQILLGMNLADEYFREKKRNQILESELELKDKELYSLKHELINLQLDLEKLQKEISKV